MKGAEVIESTFGGWVAFGGIRYVAQITVVESAQPVRSTGELVNCDGLQPDYEGLYVIGHRLKQTVRVTLQKLSISEGIKIAGGGPIEATLQIEPSVMMAMVGGRKMWLFFLDDLTVDETGATVVLVSKSQSFKAAEKREKGGTIGLVQAPPDFDSGLRIIPTTIPAEVVRRLVEELALRSTVGDVQGCDCGFCKAFAEVKALLEKRARGYEGEKASKEADPSELIDQQSVERRAEKLLRAESLHYMRIGDGPWLREVGVAPGVSRWDEVTEPAELARLEGR